MSRLRTINRTSLLVPTGWGSHLSSRCRGSSFNVDNGRLHWGNGFSMRVLTQHAYHFRQKAEEQTRRLDICWEEHPNRIFTSLCSLVLRPFSQLSRCKWPRFPFPGNLNSYETGDCFWMGFPKQALTKSRGVRSEIKVGLSHDGNCHCHRQLLQLERRSGSKSDIVLHWRHIWDKPHNCKFWAEKVPKCKQSFAFACSFEFHFDALLIDLSICGQQVESVVDFQTSKLPYHGEVDKKPGGTVQCLGESLWCFMKRSVKVSVKHLPILMSAQSPSDE